MTLRRTQLEQTEHIGDKSTNDVMYNEAEDSVMGLNYAAIYNCTWHTELQFTPKILRKRYADGLWLLNEMGAQ